MPYKWVRRWVPGYYYWKGGKRIHVRGHYRWVKIWVPSVRRLTIKDYEKEVKIPTKKEQLNRKKELKLLFKPKDKTPKQKESKR